MHYLSVLPIIYELIFLFPKKCKSASRSQSMNTNVKEIIKLTLGVIRGSSSFPDVDEGSV